MDELTTSPANKLNKHNKSQSSKRNRSSSSDFVRRRNNTFVDKTSGLLKHRAVSCDHIHELDFVNSREKTPSTLRKSFQKTIQGVKKMFSGEAMFDRPASYPALSKQTKKKHLSSTNDSILDETKFLTPTENRRRRLSLANKIDTWLEETCLISSATAPRQRKVSWADLNGKAQESVNSDIKKDSLHSSEGNLQNIIENHSPEQITFNSSNHLILNINHDEPSNVINTSNERKSGSNTGQDLNLAAQHRNNSLTMETRRTPRSTDTKVLNSNRLNIIQKDANNNSNQLGLNRSNLTTKARSFEDLDIDLQDHCDRLHRSLTAQPRKNTEKIVANENKENSFLTVDDIKTIIEKEVHQKLDGKSFDTKLVTSWCKDISNSIRDELKLVTDNNKKVVATTYIGSKLNQSQVHVSVKCQKHMNTDDFLTVALEGDDMFIWITLLIANY